MAALNARKLGVALSARLFAATAVPRSGRGAEDPQAAARSAIRRCRRRLGLTQREAAALVGLSRLAYHRIESGRRRIRAHELTALARAYNCHLGELVEDAALARALSEAAAAA